MFKQLRPALASLLVLSLVTGVAYPLLVTGIAQLAFPEQANGSLLRDAEGKVLGSRLIAQKFDGEVVPFAAFGGRLRHRFQCREQPGAEQPGTGRAHRQGRRAGAYRRPGAGAAGAGDYLR